MKTDELNMWIAKSEQTMNKSIGACTICNVLTARRPPHGRTINQRVSLYKKTQNVDGTAATPRPHNLSAATAQSRVLDIPVFRGRPRGRSNSGGWPFFSTSSIQAATSSYTRCFADAKRCRTNRCQTSSGPSLTACGERPCLQDTSHVHTKHP